MTVRIKPTERVIVSWPLTGVPASSTVQVAIDAGTPFTPTFAAAVLSLKVAGPDVAPDGATVLTRGSHAVEAVVTTPSPNPLVIRPTLDTIEVM